MAEVLPGELFSVFGWLEKALVVTAKLSLPLLIVLFIEGLQFKADSLVFLTEAKEEFEVLWM